MRPAVVVVIKCHTERSRFSFYGPLTYDTHVAQQSMEQLLASTKAMTILIL